MVIVELKTILPMSIATTGADSVTNSVVVVSDVVDVNVGEYVAVTVTEYDVDLQLLFNMSEFVFAVMLALPYGLLVKVYTRLIPVTFVEK